MSLESVRVDGDDLTDVLDEMETSFDISLPKDLTHVATVGDLFEEILKARAPDGRGDRCDTAMAFYRLRRLMASLGFDAAAGPKTLLAGRSLPSPKKVGQLLKAELGLRPPGIVVSRTGCLLAGGILIAAIGCALLFRSWDWLALGWLIVPVFALDRGDWKGEWETLGSLSRAIASRNVSTLARAGARNKETDWWRSFSHLLAGTVLDDRDGTVKAAQLTRSTRFAFS